LYDKLAKILNLNIVDGKNPSDYITIVINKALAYNKMIVRLNMSYFIYFYYNNDTSEKLNRFKKENDLEQTTMTGGVRRRRSSKKSSKKTSKRNSKKSSKTMKGGAKRKTSKKSSKTRGRK
jgi:tRNA G10  N-methylase Trm11